VLGPANRPTGLELHFTEAFVCGTAPLACGGVLRWERTFHIYVVQELPPLSVRLTTPTDGQTVSETVTLTAEAAGGNVQSYTFLVDGTTLQSGPTATALWDTRATSNGPHNLSVAVTDDRGRSAHDAITVTVANLTPPSAPSGLTAKARAGGRIDLAWTDTSMNEDGFAVERPPTPSTGIACVPSTLPAPRATRTRSR
jgi:hypothetical protein